ncbi:hypothetical protein BH10PSE1_BH10PSE1_24480 [soil metagenome]
MALASVLVVDGDRDALAATRAALGAGDYAVHEAPNGRRALESIRSDPPDVLITEVLMPEGDGIELITAVRGPYPDLRIIAVSDRRFLGELDLLNMARLLGADAALDKPLGAETLLGTIAGLLASGAPEG